MYSVTIYTRNYRYPKMCCCCLKPTSRICDVSDSRVKKKTARKIVTERTTFTLPLCEDCELEYNNSHNAIIINILFPIIIVLIFGAVTKLLQISIPYFWYVVLGVYILSAIVIFLYCKDSYSKTISSVVSVQYVSPNDLSNTAAIYSPAMEVRFQNLEYAKEFCKINDNHIVTDTVKNKKIYVP